MIGKRFESFSLIAVDDRQLMKLVSAALCRMQAKWKWKDFFTLLGAKFKLLVVWRKEMEVD
jgi:hypothetical protein